MLPDYSGHSKTISSQAWCFITHVIDCSCTMCRILVSVNWCAFFHRINEQCLKWCYVLLIKTWPLLYTLSVMHIHTLNDLHISPHNVFSLEISCIYYTPNLGNNMSNCVYTVKDSQFKQRNYQKHWSRKKYVNLLSTCVCVCVLSLGLTYTFTLP